MSIVETFFILMSKWVSVKRGVGVGAGVGSRGRGRGRGRGHFFFLFFFFPLFFFFLFFFFFFQHHRSFVGQKRIKANIKKLSLLKKLSL